MADDELNQKQSPDPEGESRVAELEGLLAQKDEELIKANTRIVELDQALAESNEKLTSINDSLGEAVASYRAMLVQANPEVLEELVTGNTIEYINESLSKAKTLISKVRQGLEAEISSAKVPAGAPPRTPPDLSALSPREKIQYAIGGRK